MLILKKKTRQSRVDHHAFIERSNIGYYTFSMDQRFWQVQPYIIEKVWHTLQSRPNDVTAFDENHHPHIDVKLDSLKTLVCEFFL
jgi:hypothetical protein